MSCQIVKTASDGRDVREADAMKELTKRQALEALIEKAAQSLNLSEEESKALIAPIAEQFKTSREKT